jgi:hypothetical protein
MWGPNLFLVQNFVPLWYLGFSKCKFDDFLNRKIHTPKVKFKKKIVRFLYVAQVDNQKYIRTFLKIII